MTLTLVRILITSILLGLAFLFVWIFIKIWVICNFHLFPRAKRRLEDFFKIDPYAEKKDELRIENMMDRKVAIIPTKEVKSFLEQTPEEEIFIGVKQEGKKKIPVKVPLAALSRHTHIMGSTGSGKTKLCVLPIAIQLLRRDCGLVCITFKEDRELGHVLKKEAEAMGKKFYYLSLNPRDASHEYNPLYNGSPGNFVERLMVALDLEMPGAAKFYTHAQRAALTPVFSYFAKNRIIPNLRDLHDILISEKHLAKILKEETGREVSQREMEHLMGAGYALSRLVHDDIARRIMSYNPDIRFEEILNEKSVLYCNLKTDINPALAVSVGKMLLLDMQYHCGDRSEDSKLFGVFIDEFQDAACQAFLDLLTKLRVSNLGFFLANQNLSQLKEVSKEFAQTVHTNTATKVVFRLRDAQDAKLFAEDSGTTEYMDTGMTQKGIGKDGLEYLDGERDVAGRITNKAKTYLHANRFLALPDGEGIIFPPSGLAEVVRFGFVVDREEDGDLTKTYMDEDSLVVIQHDTEEDGYEVYGVDFYRNLLRKAIDD